MLPIFCIMPFFCVCFVVDALMRCRRALKASALAFSPAHAGQVAHAQWWQTLSVASSPFRNRAWQCA